MTLDEFKKRFGNEINGVEGLLDYQSEAMADIWTMLTTSTHPAARAFMLHIVDRPRLIPVAERVDLAWSMADFARDAMNESTRELFDCFNAMGNLADLTMKKIAQTELSNAGRSGSASETDAARAVFYAITGRVTGAANNAYSAVFYDYTATDSADWAKRRADAAREGQNRLLRAIKNPFTRSKKHV